MTTNIEILLGTLIEGVSDETLEQGVTLKLSNGKELYVEKDAVNPSTVSKWPWKIENQYFIIDSHAGKYLQQRIVELTTGIRVLLKKNPVPDICGVDGRACRHPNECDSALCMDCPVAEKFHAEKDGVTIVYAVDAEQSNL